MLFNGWWSHEGRFRVILDDYIEYFTCGKTTEPQKNGMKTHINAELGNSLKAEHEPNMNGGDNTVTEETCLNNSVKS